MVITKNIFSSFIQCKMKACLELSGKAPSVNDYHNWKVSQIDIYSQKCINLLKTDTDFYSRVKGVKKEQGDILFVDNQINSSNIASKISAISFGKVRNDKLGKYILFRCVPNDKITTIDKLILGFDAFVSNGALLYPAIATKIIYGNRFKISQISISKYFTQIAKITNEIRITCHDISKHQIHLSGKCSSCEFYSYCYNVAKEKDLLCLLSSMKPKEQLKENRKGIFTVTQLSYTFRPRKNSHPLNSRPPKYFHSLKALAIRENKIYIAEKPKISTITNPVFVDVEGIPDNCFYYLIGVWFLKAGEYRKISFWADTISDESTMWDNFVSLISGLGNPSLMHYGHYETVFFKRMQNKYPSTTSAHPQIATIIKEAKNVLSIIYGRIYFPTYSNSLKEIAQYLDFSWTTKDISGLSSIFWRNSWEETQNPDFKSNLISYNIDDCIALSIIFNNIISLSDNDQLGQPNIKSNKEIVFTDTLKREKPFRFGRNEFYFPQLKAINEAAYWDYQRDKIYFKTKSQAKKRICDKKPTKKRHQINSIINSTALFKCISCHSSKIEKHSKGTRLINDLKFSSTGIKRYVFQYNFQRYRCLVCGKTFQEIPDWGFNKKYGNELKAFSIYLHLELKVPSESVVNSINQLFKSALPISTISTFKSELALYYKSSYSSILNNLICGNVIHADETKISVKGITNYIWVFANSQSVYYYYTETREGDFLKSFLKDFHGVLVSDFYSAYESIECPQQKCLIHLIRDFNDDLFKNPFNEPFKKLVSDFSSLLAPIIGSIHRFGLKAYHLNKFNPSIKSFFDSLIKVDDNNELFNKYEKRLIKNKDCLFTFIDFNGIPWNNNNAEHAVKAFAILRRMINGVTTKNGIKDYLILLSILQTCKYREINFLNFLRAREIDINNYSNKRNTHFNAVTI